MRWEGLFIDQDIFEEGKLKSFIIPLRKVFRMTDNILRHIQEKKMNPKLGSPNGSGIKGPAVVTETFNVQGEIPAFMASILLDKITKVFKRNIHFGDVAILFDSKDIDLVLPEHEGGIEILRTSLNTSRKAKFSEQ